MDASHVCEKPPTRRGNTARDTTWSAAKDGARPKHKIHMNTDIENESLQEKAEDMKRGVGSMLENARGKAGEIYERARDRVRHWSDDGVEYVRENPTTTLLAALAVGFAIGFAVRR
jgi:ElaB/YqjD/DUF883 family membrane-anchored ribosome-binding protein